MESAWRPWLTGDYLAPADYRYSSAAPGDVWLVLYTIRGRGFFVDDGRSLQLEPGDLLVLGPHVPQEYGAHAGPWRFLWAVFAPRPSLRFWLEPELDNKALKLTIRDPEIRERIRQALAYAHSDSCRPEPFMLCEGPHEVGRTRSLLDQELVSNNLEAALLLALRERHANRRLDPRVRRVVRLVTTYPAADHDLSTLARAVHLSPSRLRHLFKAELGESLWQTVLAIRLRHAAHLLELTSKTTAEIARECGFHSAGYLARQFRRRFATSPSAYRAAIRAERPTPPIV